MKIQFLLVPYDSGRREWRMGRGPSYLLRHGVGSSIRALGHEVDAEYVEPGGVQAPNPPASTEIATSFSLYREVADRARTAHENGALPIILGGNCGVSLGAMASLVPRRQILSVGDGEPSYPDLEDVGVLWLDAHGDFNTSETSPSGNIHGQILAALAGYGDERLVSVGGPGRKVDPRRIVIVGARDLDSGERALLHESGVHVRTIADIDRRGMSEIAQEALRLATDGANGVYVMLDMDAVDPSEAPGVGTPVPGGITYREAHLMMEMVAESGKLLGLDLVEVNPILDRENKTAILATQLALSAAGKHIF